MSYEVIFDPAARQDLEAIFNYIESRAGADVAERFVSRLYERCMSLTHTAERGTRRDELRRGLRTMGYRRRATILFQVERSRKQVIILGVYYGGRDYESAFADRDSE